MHADELSVCKSFVDYFIPASCTHVRQFRLRLFPLSAATYAAINFLYARFFFNFAECLISPRSPLGPPAANRIRCAHVTCKRLSSQRAFESRGSRKSAPAVTTTEMRAQKTRTRTLMFYYVHLFSSCFYTREF